MDYFTAFGMSWLHPTAFSFAVLQNALEVVIGVALLLGLRMKETAWGVTLFMGFFTVLTLIIALTNPVSDCGCFGDALILTNWQTFFKNLFLIPPTVLVFMYRKKYKPAYGNAGEWVWVGITTAVVLWITLHCYRHLPWIDFRPYHIGADIAYGMTIPEGMPVDEYHTTVIMERNGVVKEFPVNDYPWDDSTWVYIDVKTVQIKEGYTPPIRDFSITATNGFDLTEDVLSDESFTFLLVAHSLSKSNRKALEKASAIADFCNEHGYRFYCLTGSTQSEIEHLKSTLGLRYDFCTADDTMLKTIIRANPGLVLLQKGTVIGKWHHNDFPAVADMSVNPNLLSYALKHQAEKSRSRLNNLLMLLLLFSASIFHACRTIKKTE